MKFLIIIVIAFVLLVSLPLFTQESEGAEAAMNATLGIKCTPPSGINYISSEDGVSLSFDKSSYKPNEKFKVIFNQPVNIENQHMYVTSCLADSVEIPFFLSVLPKMEGDGLPVLMYNGLQDGYLIVDYTYTVNKNGELIYGHQQIGVPVTEGKSSYVDEHNLKKLIVYRIGQPDFFTISLYDPDLDIPWWKEALGTVGGFAIDRIFDYFVPGYYIANKVVGHATDGEWDSIGSEVTGGWDEEEYVTTEIISKKNTTEVFTGVLFKADDNDKWYHSKPIAIATLTDNIQDNPIHVFYKFGEWAVMVPKTQQSVFQPLVEAGFDITDNDGDNTYFDIDNCPTKYNPNQKDSDNDKVGDVCDSTPRGPDTDLDGIADMDDNCVYVVNKDQRDSDNDRIGDVCDSTPTPDTDLDGIADMDDNCVYVVNKDQRDSDNDGIGDLCDYKIPLQFADPQVIKTLRQDLTTSQLTDQQIIKIVSKDSTTLQLSEQQIIELVRSDTNSGIEELMVTITDSVVGDGTQVDLEFSTMHVNYEITAMQNGEEIFKVDAHSMELAGSNHMIDSIGSDENPIDIKIVSLGIGIPGDEENWSGPTGIIAEKQVVPEFGTIAMMILVVAITSLIAVTAKSRVIPRF